MDARATGSRGRAAQLPAQGRSLTCLVGEGAPYTYGIRAGMPLPPVHRCSTGLPAGVAQAEVAMMALPGCPNTLSGFHIIENGRCRGCRGSENYITALIAARAKHIQGDRDGATYDRDRDLVRLNQQMQRVFDVVKDGKARTPKELEAETGDEWASISARLRDLRKAKFGGNQVQRLSLGGGLFAYRLLVRAADALDAYRNDT